MDSYSIYPGPEGRTGEWDALKMSEDDWSMKSRLGEAWPGGKGGALINPC